MEWDKMETFSMEKMEKPVSNSPFSPFYAIAPSEIFADMQDQNGKIKIIIATSAISMGVNIRGNLKNYKS